MAADFVVFVTAVPTQDCRPTTTAHAVVCLADREGIYGPVNRPLAGHVNFCPTAGGGAAATTAPRSLEAVIDTAVHELLHTLYMSRGLYNAYQRPEGSPECAPRRACCVLRASKMYGCDGDSVAWLPEANGLAAAAHAGTAWPARWSAPT